MPWLDPPELPPHECRTPKATDKDLDRKWACPTCGTVWQWKSVRVQYGDPDNSPPGTVVAEWHDAWCIFGEDKRPEHDAFRRITWEDSGDSGGR